VRPQRNLAYDVHGAAGDWNAPWPWGFTDPSLDYAVMDCANGGTPGTCEKNDLWSVGSTRKSARFGQMDLAGSVAEPTLDTYFSDFYSRPEASGTDVASVRDEQYRVYRGGGFSDAPDRCRASARSIATPTEVSTKRGIRCARGP